MTRFAAAIAVAVCCAAVASRAVRAQTPATDTAAAKKTKTPGPLFDDQSVIEFTLTANFGQFKRDARDNSSPYRPARITYLSDGKTVSVPVKIKPRGIWRRKTCELPPIRLNFDKDSVKHTLFAKQNRVKLVIHCRNSDESEQNVLSEFQLYRVQNLLTPLSFKARLVHVTYVNSQKGDTIAKRYAFLGEEPEEAARRLGGKPIIVKNVMGDDLDEDARAFFGVFQYFIGNTDFSVTELHNVLLLHKDSIFEAFPIARDWDWSGAVNARYAFPDYRLPIKHVTQRLMKGDCAPKEKFEAVFKLFRDRKDAIYALYHDSLAAPMKPDLVRETLKYFDEFYSDINDKWRADHNITSKCGPS